MISKKKLQYLLLTQRLHQLYVVKRDISFNHLFKHTNKADKSIDFYKDKLLNNIIDGNKIGDSKKIAENIIDTALQGQANTLMKKRSKIIQGSVDQTVGDYSKILSSRFDSDAYKLKAKIEAESKLSDSEIKKKYGELYRKNAKNIVRDALHTNQSRMSFLHALDKGYKYKVWMNGRARQHRIWHRANFIESVPIDDYFIITGSYRTEMMYPGDLAGGAENVANCRCWLSYTNSTPSNLKSKSSFNIPSNSYLHGKNKSSSNQNSLKITSKIKNKIIRTISNIGNKIKNTGSKITENVKRKTVMINISSKPKQNSKRDFSKFKLNESITKFSKAKNKAVKIGNKTVYGVGESSKDKLAFEYKYGIKKEDLTSEEYKFIKAYSDEGYYSLNNYFREIKGELNPVKRWRIKRKYSKLWEQDLANSKYYISFNKAIKSSKSVFKKGKILEESLVVVRRQKSPMTKFVEGDNYHSDSFLSTSISENVKPEEYGDYINYIAIPKGIKILYIEGITETPQEFEILFDKNVDLRLIREKSEFIAHWEMIS